jgi:ABC-2 type transport system ATP-binding protein
LPASSCQGRIVAAGPVDELRAAGAGRVLRVVVPDAPQGWAAGIPGARVVSQQGGDTLLELEPGLDDQAVLHAALRTGRVTHFAWRQPTLVELFREAVADPQQRPAQEAAA